ncbi:MAG TPA: hypothetical protein IAA61_11185 [Candidatus Ornithomonoglobus merdipullorum]|uniref:Uncharacterized protein n=1 Tax=Candidatus Ornithomonoglobus merdipullorum TaxID=2840895 RepID=A0A9D1SG20_9FIRM|nr:hypothetical protein [Candidatus Ornithomonoglobus merdipullorum]
MKKKFEMPIVDIRCFEFENVVTASGDPDPRTANEKGRSDLSSKGIGSESIFDLTIVP